MIPAVTAPDEHVLRCSDLAVPNIKPHSVVDDMLQLVAANERPPLHEWTLLLFQAIRELESIAKWHDPSFKSPVFARGGRDKQRWGEYAKIRQEAVEDKMRAEAATKRAQSVEQLASVLDATRELLTLEHLYEAAWAIVISRQVDLEVALMYLDMQLVFEGARDEPGGALGRLADVWQRDRAILDRAEQLTQVLLNEACSRSEGLRCLIFVQRRLTAHILEHFLRNHRNKSIQALRAAVIYAAKSPANSRLRVTPMELKDRIKAFADGDVSILITTKVAEEGLDVSAANCVIRFDEVQTPVSLYSTPVSLYSTKPWPWPKG
eukprot:jgi/Ulvmu1/11277/UM073_0049.1